MFWRMFLSTFFDHFSVSFSFTTEFSFDVFCLSFPTWCETTKTKNGVNLMLQNSDVDKNSTVRKHC